MKNLLRSVTLGSLALVVTGGCYPPLTQPAPQLLTVRGSPTTVIQAATRTLVEAQFEIAHSDPATGILQAKRARGPKGNDAYLRCSMDRASIAANNLRSTISLTLSASAKGDSSSVRLSTVVSAAYPALQGTMARAENESDCISNGTLEQDLVAALTRG